MNSGFLRLLSKIHVYGGLYCAGFLVLMGISGFLFNHEGINLPERKLKTEIIQIDLTEANNDIEKIVQSCKQLQIFGDTSELESLSDDHGNLHFQLSRPAKSYYGIINKDGDEIELTTYVKPILTTLKDMHDMLGDSIDHWSIKIFRIYSESAAITAFLVVLITFFYWIKKSFKKSSLKWLALFSALSTLFIFISSWLRG